MDHTTVNKSAASERRHLPGSRRSPAPGIAHGPASAGFRPAGAALAIAAALATLPSGVDAQATGAQVIHGQASLVQQGNSLVVTTQNGAGTGHSAINWQSFSVPAGATTRFNQPNAQSTSINRVLGNNPSGIYGTLSSNGQLVLVNPSGITVGAGAVVDTAGFTASTLRMSDADALAGRLVFGADGSTPPGALRVDGLVLGRTGDVVLIAPQVEVGAQALVQAPNGATLLLAGQRVQLTGRGLEGIRLELQAPGDSALNLGTLQGDAVGIFASQLQHSGRIQANGVTVSGGKVVLQATGDNLVSGRIEAMAPAGRGGDIDVLGQRVGLLAGAALEASGEQGGGRIRIGGDFQGKNPEVMNATRTYLDAGATVKADATVNGDGGRIIVWADDQTQSAGAISARGGPQGGDGGFVEVSGKQKLQFASEVDTRAPNGKTGTLLLDPFDITVDATGTAAMSDVDAFDTLPNSAVGINAAVLNAATTNVTLQATNDIYIAAAIDMANPGIGITAQAGRYLDVLAPITTRGGAVSLLAGEDFGLPLPSESRLNVQAAIDTTSAGLFPLGAAVTLKSRVSDTGGMSLRVAAPISAGSSAVTIAGQSVEISDASISGGAISAIGDSGSVNVNWSSLTTTDGNIDIFGGAGTNINASNLSTSGGGLNVEGASYVFIQGSTIDTAGGHIAIKGGSLTSGSTGIHITGQSSIHAGTGAVDMIGESGLAEGFVFDLGEVALLTGPAATISGSDIRIQGSTSASATAAVRVSNELISATSSVHLTARNGDLAIYNSTIENSGAGGTRLEAMPMAASPAPGISIDPTSVVQNVAGGTSEIRLVADSIYLDGRIDSGVARTMFTPVTTKRAISLGGFDETGKLNLTEAELNNVVAGVIVVGGGAFTGGLTIESPVGQPTPITLTSSPALSLIQGGSATISQNAGAALRVSQLNVDAGSVNLGDANTVQSLSGRANDAAGSGFFFSNGGNLNIGLVDGIAGIASNGGPITLAANGGSLTQTEAVKGASLRLLADNDITLVNDGNSFTAVNAQSGALAGSVLLINSNTASTSLTGSSAGAFNYRSLGATVTEGITSGSSAVGDAFGTAAVSVESGSITQGASLAGIDASSLNGSIFLKATNGSIGAATSPLRVTSSGGVWAQAAGAGGNIYLTTPTTSFMVGSLVASGAGALTGNGGSLDLRSAGMGGALDWNGFAMATLGSGGGLVSAGGPITANSDVSLAGTLAPGGVGGIGSMAIAGNLDVQAGAVMKFDLSGASHDSINVGGNLAFPLADSYVVADASLQPPPASYELISVAGATGGTLPILTGSVMGASLAFGSLKLNVAPAPTPAPAPTGSLAERISAFLGSGTTLASIQEAVVQLESVLASPAPGQEKDDPKPDALTVTDTQCKP